MANITDEVAKINGINLHYVEAGSGPLVVLLHGFPACWYSWREQLHALAEAGYHVVAPDQRGYGGTDSPEQVNQYTIFHLVGDIVGLVQLLGYKTAVVVGHDWGAEVAWGCAQMRPDVFSAVAGLSVPITARMPEPPSVYWKSVFGDRFFYQLYFQTPGVAEHELQHDVAMTMRKLMVDEDGSNAQGGAAFNPDKAPPAASYMLEFLPDPGDNLPAWLSKDDIAYLAAEFERSGFRGGLNWYRNLDLNWELTAPFQNKVIEQPALFIIGEHDLVPFNAEIENGMKALLPGLRKAIVLPGVGHWTAQEAPQAVNKALVEFLHSL